MLQNSIYLFFVLAGCWNACELPFRQGVVQSANVYIVLGIAGIVEAILSRLVSLLSESLCYSFRVYYAKAKRYFYITSDWCNIWLSIYMSKRKVVITQVYHQSFTVWYTSCDCYMAATQLLHINSIKYHSRRSELDFVQLIAVAFYFQLITK